MRCFKVEILAIPNLSFVQTTKLSQATPSRAISFTQAEYNQL